MKTDNNIIIYATDGNDLNQEENFSGVFQHFAGCDKRKMFYICRNLNLVV